MRVKARRANRSVATFEDACVPDGNVDVATQHHPTVQQLGLRSTYTGGVTSQKEDHCISITDERAAERQ
jgi:hypothetical protein